MYLPYRKAYLTGMNPLSFVTFFTFGELGMMSALAIGYNGLFPLWRELVAARGVIFWLMLGGFIWVIGDLFQQYAAKYLGISRGIPLSNSNQLWGLLWGVLVFGELHNRSSSNDLQVVGGSLLMMLGVGAVAFSSVSGGEQTRWKQAARREGRRYGIAADYIEARMDGRQAAGERAHSRTLWDWLLVAAATAIFVFFAALARVPQMSIHWGPAALLTAALLVLLLVCGFALWRTTRFN
jgi:drug/metabolite transporter (DMT)-like permease